MKLYYKKILVLSLSFLALSFTWSLYYSYVPIFLKKYFQSDSVIGFIMSLNDYAVLFILPIFGTLSDRTNTKIGKRMPYILFGMAAAALILSTIPLHLNMMQLIASIIALNIVMAAFKAPIIALMPDLTPEHLRSSANGIINLMSGAGAILAYLLGSQISRINKAYPFYIASAFIIISLSVLYIYMKEKREPINCSESPDILLDNSRCKIDIDEYDEREKARNVYLLLLCVFFLFCSFNAVEVFFAVYGRYYLGIGEAGSARILTVFSIFIAASSLPAGLIGDKIGRKRAILIGQSIMILIFGVLFLTTSKSMLEVLIGASGVCWALVYINSYPMFISMAENSNIGRFTGYYYVAASLAAIISIPFLGFLIEVYGHDIFFIYTGVSFILSLIFIIFVKMETVYYKCNNAIQSDYNM